MAQNGIIHLINGLILPPENSLYDVIELDNSLSVFRSAIKISGLNWFIRRSDPLTVFAPDDNAFASLPPGTLNSLYGNPREMQNVLKHHLVEGVLYSPALTSGHGYRLRPAYGRAITLKKRLDQIEINSDTVIKKKDISASNGVLHIVNKVLLP